ncbi:MAG: hypothetical protein AB3N33_03325 [Puniceicoccaceae bacterium]
MKTKNLRTLLGTTAACLLGGISTFGATTDPVGAVNLTVPVGTTILSAPFLTAVEFQANVDSVSSSDVGFASTVPTLSGPHYLHALTGTDAGRIFTIDSQAASSVTLVDVPAGLAPGDTVAIRRYLTVNDLGSVPNGTTVTLLNPGASPTVATFFFGSWSPSGDIFIAPGEGFVINTGTAFDLVLYGSVSVNDVIFEADAGSSIVGNLDPVDGTDDVLAALLSSAPNGTTITELVSGSPNVYTLFFGSWTPDPASIDITNLRTIVVNSGSDLDIVNTGIVVP